MNLRLLPIPCVATILAFAITIGPGSLERVSAEALPPQTVATVPLDQGGTTLSEEWAKFVEQTRIWLEQLALLFAQAPLIGLIIAEVLKIIGQPYWWCVGAVIVGLLMGGFFALGRRRR